MKKLHIFSLLVNGLCAALIALSLSACGNEKKAEKEKSAAKAVVEAPAPIVEEEQPKEIVEEKPVQDKHFAYVKVADNANTGEIYRAKIELSSPFNNPFDQRDISVEAYIAGDSNGFSANIPLYFAGGDNAKSTWILSTIFEKSGSYKITFNVRASDGAYFSFEYPVKVEKGEQAKFAKLKKRAPSRFTIGEDGFRASGGDFNINISPEARDALLDSLKAAGANTARLSIEAPITLLTNTDNGDLKAGAVNLAIVDRIEAFLDAAKARSMFTILRLASPLSFGDAIWENSYFAKSGIAPKPADFFTSQDAQKKYDLAISYLFARIGNRSDILALEPLANIDAWDIKKLDVRANWFATEVATLRDIERETPHPIILSSATKSDIEFVWGSDSCDLLAFEIVDSKDFAESIMSTSRFFKKQYKKPVAISRAVLDVDSDKYAIHAHNSIWAAAITPSPMLPMVDFSKSDTANDSLKALKSANAFAEKFNLSDKNLEAVSPRETVISKAKKPAENYIIFQAAFGETLPELESSPDIAEAKIDDDGSIDRNTIPAIWKSGAYIGVKIDSVPDNKCTFGFDIVKIPLSAKNLNLTVLRNDEPLMKTPISIADMKKITKSADGKYALVNIPVTAELQKGDQKLSFQLSDSDGGKASIEVANFRIVGMGSNRGVSSVRTYGIADKKRTCVYLWFKRAATDTYTYNKYGLGDRDLGELKSFEYTLDMTAANGGKTYKVTWWDTRLGMEIAVGELNTDANGKLKLRTPQFKLDTACAVEESK